MHGGSKIGTSPASYLVGTQPTSSNSSDNDAKVWSTKLRKWQVVRAAVRMRLYAPAMQVAPWARANTNQLHVDWVAYHTFTTSLELRAFASVARTLPAHNATGATMDVVAYSAYAGIGIYTDEYNYLGDSPESYGVNWTALALEGLTVAMGGYGCGPLLMYSTTYIVLYSSKIFIKKRLNGTLHM